MSTHRFMRASAGTGKTYQLVQAYLGHVRDGGLSPTNVVAITFTRKAAAELRSRIRTGLVEQGARRAVLDALALAPIANFHGLALQMLQSFGAEVGFVDMPRVMGELGEDVRLFRTACEEAWFGANSGVHESLAAVALRLALGECRRGVSFVDAMWRAVATAREDDDPRVLTERFATYDPRGAQERVHAQWVAFRDKVAAGCSSLGDKTRQKVLAFVAHGEPPLEPSSVSPEDVSSHGTFQRGSMGYWARHWLIAMGELKGARLGDLASSQERKDLVAALDIPTAEAVCTELAPHVARLMQSAIDRYGVLKRETRSCDFPDLLEQAISVLERDAALYARVRERFKVVLVDEAQDTNASQRRFVRLIAGLDGPVTSSVRFDGHVANSVRSDWHAAHTFVRDSDPASLFVVGDTKQAIYTFRGADPRSFALFESDLVSLGASLENLDVSRRSTPGIVRGINHLGAAMLGEGYEALAPLQQSAAGTDAVVGAPLVGALGPAPGVNDAPPALTWLLPACPRDAAAPERCQAEARAVAALMRRAVDAGSEPSSFAILLRATTKAQTFARALAKVGLPSVITGGGGFYAQAEIVDVIALLTWLTDPDALFDAAVAMRSPLIGFADSALLHLFGAGDRSRLLALRRGDTSSFVSTYAGDHESAKALAAVLPELVTATANMGAGRSVSRMLDALDARAVLLALPFGEQKLANIERFLELAWNHERSSGRGTAHFVHEQRDHARRGAAEPLRAIGAARDRAVSIMTVHQAKGLEFEHVVLADLSHERRGDGAPVVYSREHGFIVAPERRAGIDPDGTSKTLKSEVFRKADATLRDEQEAEMRRLLYVAVTRARAKLTFVMTDYAPAKGFARVLTRWVPAAIEAGVMRRIVEGELTAGQAQGSAPTGDLTFGVLRDLRISHAPAGTRFALSVTDLENAIAPVDESKAQIRRRAALETDVALDPLARGRLTHMVLAAMHRLQRHPSIDHFIAAELRTCGYDPADPRLVDVRDGIQAFLTSPLGCEVTALTPDARRHEMPFVVPFMVGPYTATVTGQIDLVYWSNDEPVIVDYKHAHVSSAAADAYGVQLDAYAIAIARLCGIQGPIRTRLVFLRDRAKVRDRIVTKAMRDALHAQVEAVVHELAVFPSRARTTIT